MAAQNYAKNIKLKYAAHDVNILSLNSDLRHLIGQNWLTLQNRPMKLKRFSLVLEENVRTVDQGKVKKLNDYQNVIVSIKYTYKLTYIKWD